MMEGSLRVFEYFISGLDLLDRESLERTTYGVWVRATLPADDPITRPVDRTISSAVDSPGKQCYNLSI
jgi:hypothetical protein